MTQVRTETQRVSPRTQHPLASSAGITCILLVEKGGRLQASFSVVGGAMLQSSIAIQVDSLPSDLSGSEVVAISWDLALTAQCPHPLRRLS